ncbi:hypothetical protein NHX12_022582, partial [Muraenolepis orangiensis]
PSFGYIEREDLVKFPFKFTAYFGNSKALIPGVKVHFTAVKEKNGEVATDVKVAPGGTESVGMEIYEALVSQPILEPQRCDSTVTLLKNDHVLFNLLTDLVTDKRKATNIRPQIPHTYTSTKEAREMGVLTSITETKGLIASEKHGELTFELKENLSNVDFTSEDVKEEVEFTVRGAQRAIRIRREKEPLLLTLCTSPPPRPSPLEGLSSVHLDQELYEGIVSQPASLPSAHTPGFPGQISANIGPIKTNVTYGLNDCAVTLLKKDHVLISLLVDDKTGKRRAANIKPKVPFTFCYTKEKREKGQVCSVEGDTGKIHSEEHGGLYFNVSDTFSDQPLGLEDVGEEVEFTVTTENKDTSWAIRLRRLVPIAALAAAKVKWSPLGFKMSDPKSFDDLSKERFQGTVLKIVSRMPQIYQIRKDDVQVKPEEKQNNIKKEKMDEDQDKKVVVKEVVEGKLQVGADSATVEVKQEQEDRPADCQSADGKEKDGPDRGRLVMTIAGEQKILHFDPSDVITGATMMVGDKVRFNIATQRVTKEERATYVEILPDSFQESTEQRRNGIVIEFSGVSGLIKCSQNPQLFFRMSEVIVKKPQKKLELNEKVEFSVVPHETADGGHQAIRITRFSENVFVPVRKLGAVGASQAKEKMTIIIAKEAKSVEAKGKDKTDTDKLKAVVKNLRSQDNKDGRESGRRKSLVDRDQRGGDPRGEDPRGEDPRRGDPRGEDPRRGDPRGGDPRRGDPRGGDPRGETHGEETHGEETHGRETHGEGTHGGVTHGGVTHGGVTHGGVTHGEADPGQRTCIDYDHGRIAVPLQEYKPVHQHREDSEYRYQEDSEYRYRSPSIDTERGYYGDPYERGYRPPPSVDPYRDGLYGDGPYRDGPYAGRRYAKRVRPLDLHTEHSPTSQLAAPESSAASSSTFNPPQFRPPIVGLASGQPTPSGHFGVSSKSSSTERTNEVDQSNVQPYDKIQNLLRTIGIKLSTGDSSKLGGVAPENLPSKEFSSAERETGHSSAKGNERPHEWMGSTEWNRLHSPSPTRAPSGEHMGSREYEYEGFLDQQEMEALKRAKEMQSLSKTIGGVYECTSNPHSVPPCTEFQPPHPPASSYSAPTSSWAPVSTTQSPTFPSMAYTPPSSTAPPAGRYGHPPGPPSRSPPRYVQGFPTFGPSSSSSLPFLSQEDQAPGSTCPMQGFPSGMIPQTPVSSQARPLTLSPIVSADSKEPNSAITVARCLKVIETVKSLKPSKSVQFSLPTELPISSVQIAGGTEDDIKAKQKEKLDQYNQRIQDKRELYVQEMRNLKKRQAWKRPAPAMGPGKPVVEPKSVWICGHSLVYWAESRAKSPEVGMQLGMDPSNVVISWKGTQGMTWPQLLPLLHQLKVKWPNPDVLIMHLGGNDLSTKSPTDLLASVKKDLSSMRSIFPECLLVWSNILPRRVWRHSADNHEVDLVRTTVNRRIHNIIVDLGGTSLNHDNIRCGSNTGQYRADGVHLSSKGIDTFNLNLQDFLEKWELEKP